MTEVLHRLTVTGTVSGGVAMSSTEAYADGLSTLYQVLQAPRRRYVIQLLANAAEEKYSVQTLSRHIATLEYDIPIEHATGDPYQNVYNSLVQSHLSKLADADIVQYNSDRKTVATGPMLRAAVLLIRLNRTAYFTLRGDSLSTPGTDCEPTIGD